MLASSAWAGAQIQFTVTPLLRPDGGSEPAITIGADGTTVVTGLSWQHFATHAWEGPFGSTPDFQGEIDAGLRTGVGGGEDADADIGSTGTLHVSTLLAFFNPVSKFKQIGVSAITCPNADTSNNFANCTRQIIDTTQSDRPWITSDGRHVYISYIDSGSSATVHVQRSDDDGYTWHRVGDPMIGQGKKTANATFNDEQGGFVADPVSHNVYAIYAAGVPGIQKATSIDHNNIYVSRSTDRGKSWTSTLVYSAPVFTPLNNAFPALAVDPTNGTLYAAWTNNHATFVSTSTDRGSTWSAARRVSRAPVNTAVMPAVAAYRGTVDVGYYGTSASSKNDQNAVWNTYLARSTDGGKTYSQLTVSPHPNHVGVVCTDGTFCPAGTRNLLDLFEVAIDHRTGQTAVVYADDTLTTTKSGKPLPQVVLAQQT